MSRDRGAGDNNEHIIGKYSFIKLTYLDTIAIKEINIFVSVIKYMYHFQLGHVFPRLTSTIEVLQRVMLQAILV